MTLLIKPLIKTGLSFKTAELKIIACTLLKALMLSPL